MKHCGLWCRNPTVLIWSIPTTLVFLALLPLPI